MHLEWDGGEDELETDVVASKTRFELYEDVTGDHPWRLVHQHRNIIAHSGEGYASRENPVSDLIAFKSPAGAYLDSLSLGRARRSSLSTERTMQ